MRWLILLALVLPVSASAQMLQMIVNAHDTVAAATTSRQFLIPGTISAGSFNRMINEVYPTQRQFIIPGDGFIR